MTLCKRNVSPAAQLIESAGRNRKKCTLPHENLTKKELKALSGEVKTYNIHQRLPWAQFKALPDDLAAEHIKYLVDTFGVNQSAIGQALGVSHITVSRYLKEHDIKLKMRRFNPATPEWCAFLGGPVETEPAPVEELAVAEEPVEPKASEPKMMAPAAHSVAFLRGSLVLSGPKGLVLQRLFEVLPDSVTVDVDFSVEGASKPALFL